MRTLVATTALIGLVIVGACSRPSPDIDSMQPGTPVTVTMKDGSVVTGRLVQAKPDAVIVDPSAGGEWKTVARDLIASVTTQQAASGQAPGAAEQAPAAASGAQSPAAPAFREFTIPAGTLLHARLDTQIASDTSHIEDRVAASVTKPVIVDGEEVVPTGSGLKGVVTQATPSGRVKGRAEVAFRFDVLAVPGGDEQRVHTRTVAVEAPSTKKSDAVKIGAPAVGGAILGGILGGGKGAAIGGAVGGGAGTAVVLSTKGKEVHLPAGSAVTVKLLEPATVHVPMSR
jgi:hypothetical protein